MRLLLAATAFALSAGTSVTMLLQTPERTHCCTVVRIDLTTSSITARETATGYTFRVEVANRKHLSAVKVGDKVWASFGARKVRLEAAGDSLCCDIIETPSGQDSLDTARPITHRRR